MSRVPIKNDIPHRKSKIKKNAEQDKVLREFLTLMAHTSIPQAKKEEEEFPGVDQAVSNEID